LESYKLKIKNIEPQRTRRKNRENRENRENGVGVASPRRFTDYLLFKLNVLVDFYSFYLCAAPGAMLFLCGSNALNLFLFLCLFLFLVCRHYPLVAILKVFENVGGVGVDFLECYVFACGVLGVVDNVVLVGKPAMSSKNLLVFLNTYDQLTVNAHTF
jgi:hypothetical protein